MSNNIRLHASLKDDVTKPIQGIRGSLASMGQEAKSGILAGVGLGAGLSAFNLMQGAVRGVVGAVGDAISAASNLNETVTKTSVIFGPGALASLERWAEGASKAMGQSKQEALDAAATFGIFGKSADLSGVALTEFSTELTELASDFASFHNASPEEAVLAIGAALRGEAEPIRRFGVLLNDATLKNRALKLGLIETTTQALTPQNRVLAAQAEILAQTSDAQGDFERTSGGLANQQRILEANLENVSAEIGEKLLPVMVDLATFANDNLVPALEGVVGALDAIGTAIGIIQDVASPTGGDPRLRALVEAATGATTAVEEEVDKQSDAWLKGAQAWVDAYHITAPELEQEVRRVAAIPRVGIEAEYQAIRGAAYQSQVEIAKGLMDGQNLPQVAFDAAMQMLEEEMTATEEAAHLSGLQTQLELALGLAASQGKDATVTAINAALAVITDRLDDLPGQAEQWGYNSALGLAHGLDRGYGVVYTAARGIGSAVRGQIAIDSEPSDPTSPLRGITKWGGNIVKTIAGDMRAHYGDALSAAGGLADAFAPGTGDGGAPGGAFAGGGAGVVRVTSPIYLDGRVITEVVNEHNLYGGRSN